MVAPPRLRLPSISDYTYQAISSWLNGCTDEMESWEEQAEVGLVLTVKSRIREAGSKMEGEGATWWNQRREQLKALATWEEFVSAVRTRFLNSNAEQVAMHAFYLTKQMNGFPSFATALTTARHNVGTISDDMFKAHLLHYSTKILYLRLHSSTSFDANALSVDQLIGHMSTVWEGLVAEGAVLNAAAPPAPRASSWGTSVVGSRHPPLGDADRLRLKAAGGCFKCRKTGHLASDCPGDASMGVPPTLPQVKVETPIIAGLRGLHLQMMEKHGLDGPTTPEEDAAWEKEWGVGDNDDPLTSDED